MTSRDANTWERPPQVPDTHFVSGLVYSDDEIFEQERKLIFGKVWSIACHESELPERYSFRTSDYAGTPIVIVRSGRGMGAVKRISHVEAKPTRYCLSAGNGICPALSSSAWRFLTRILAPT